MELINNTMIPMHTATSRKGTKVERRSTTSPLAFSMLKLEKVGKLFSALAPLVTGPSRSHWKMARMISAKPRVAMAR